MLDEQTCTGATPLHLSLDNPYILRILATAASSTQLNRGDETQRNALHHALQFSSQRCQNGSELTECSNCTCTEPATVLLQADCAVSIDAWQVSFETLSMRCKTEFIQHMKDRRARLKKIAVSNLAPSERENFRLHSQDALDSHAREVYDRLRERGIQVPDALTPQLYNKSILNELGYPHDANLFIEHGFRHITSIDIYRAHKFRSVTIIQPLPLEYIHWLLDHELDPFRTLHRDRMPTRRSPKGLTTAHYIFHSIGDVLSWPRTKISPFSQASIRALSAIILPENIADDCRCRCSLGGCRPLTSLLRGLFFFWSGQSISEIVRALGRYLAMLGDIFSATDYPAVTQFFTFTELGIHHSCHDPIDLLRSELKIEIQEDESRLQLLEELLREFEVELPLAPGNDDQHIEFVRFLQGQWADRMSSVLENNPGSPTLIRTMGFSSDHNPHPEYSVQHWIYELDQIVPEC